MKKVEFFYDIVCPYAYLAATQIESIAQKCSITIDWKPVLLGGIYKSLQAPQQPSNQWPAAKVRWNAVDLQRQIEEANVDCNFHPKHPQRTVEVMRLLACCPNQIRAEVSKKLYKAYWVDNIIFPSDEFLSQLAKDHDLPTDCYKTKQAKQALYDNTSEAIEKGVFGVPSIIFDDQLIWGNDRLFFIEEYYNGIKPQWPTCNHNGTIRFYHDFASPFSFLAAMTIGELEKNCNVTIEYCPILVGALFHNIGTPMVPLFTMSESKQSYIHRDLKRWAKWWKTDFNWPQKFPMRTILPLRVAIILPEITNHIYQAYWIRGEDISSPEVLSPLIEELGYNAEDILQQTEQLSIKEKLKENTSNAKTNYVCGVPSFYIDEQLWWGNDRIMNLARYLSQTAVKTSPFPGSDP